MSQGYIKSGELQPVKQPNPRVIYAVKIFESLLLTDLQNQVNIFLWELPIQDPTWQPSLVSVQYANYLTPAPPVVMHVATVTLYASGTITTQIVPPA
jgi:hypothetical protein